MKRARKISGKRSRIANCGGGGRSRKKSRRNPDEGIVRAQHLFRKFHGRKSTGSRIVEQTRVTPDVLTDLGRMVELVVNSREGKQKIEFPENTKVRLAAVATKKREQLYFVDGDQEIDPKRFGCPMPKDHCHLGRLVSIVYFTAKGFHKFVPSEYVHRMGEEGGEPPELNYDTQSKKLYLTGGTYRVKPEGIVH